MNVLTYFACLDLIAVATDLDEGTDSRVEGGEFGTIRVVVSAMAWSTVGLSHGGFSSIAGRNLTEELAIDFAQWARHVAHDEMLAL